MEETLYKILETAKFSNTILEISKKLYFSQPYVSKTIQKAETKYHTILIDRKKTPIALTSAGLMVLEYLKKIRQEKKELEQKLITTVDRTAIKILITNPFLYNPVLDLMTAYISDKNDLSFELSSFPVENSLDLIQNQSVDLVIGRRFLGEQVNTSRLPENRVYAYIGRECELYQPGKLVLPFKRKYFEIAKNTDFIAFENSDGIQEYIRRRFNEVGIESKQIVKVDTPLQAIRVANKIKPDSIALTSNYLAEQEYGKNNYNLLSLPDNTLNFDNAILIHQGANEIVEEVKEYLLQELTQLLNKENKELDSNL